MGRAGTTPNISDSVYVLPLFTGTLTTPPAPKRPTGTARCLSNTFHRGQLSRLCPEDQVWLAPRQQPPCESTLMIHHIALKMLSI